MPSATPQGIRPSRGINRWTVEPLFGVVYVLFLAMGVVAVALTAVGLDAALVAVIVILLWTAAAVVWSRRRAARHSR